MSSQIDVENPPAAEELFFARGFDNVSVSDIAERAEVGRTTFFRHFSDKQRSLSPESSSYYR